NSRTIPGPTVTEASDLTGKVQLRGLPAGQHVFYRVTFADPHDLSLVSEPVVGHLRTPSRQRGDVSFVWSGDTAGQGWGIDESRGGMRIYETMRQLTPDLFVHSGDTIYADGPLQESVPLRDGTVWRNLVTPEKAKVAETLAEFRGNFRYNLLDANVRRFNADVPVIAQWDDHETANNWYPGETLTDARYTLTDASTLAARANQAFHEYFPTTQTHQEPGRVYRKLSYGPSLDLFVIDLRTYRAPNSANDQAVAGDATAVLGERQLAWLQRELATSQATWKVICSDMPVGLVVPDGAASEAVAQGRPEALGRELEVAALLSSIKQHGVQNVVWLTADVHYCAAHHYDPARAVFTDFLPFWEFVTGPLHAGTFGPNALDTTFGPEVRFQKAADHPNQPPSDGNQFFGHVAIDRDTEAMRVRLIDVNGAVLHVEELAPQR
ncbi:MAG TPA: alkaline phosphatase D family protein, partial [Acidimicrobiales bacterium]|nr:alkaline phosphatase D family protein [Acidimicrobiales bacterium]